MSRKLLLSSMAVLLLQGGIALAGSGSREERPVERERGPAGRTWVWNLGDRSELVVAAPDDFDPSGMEVDLHGTARMERKGRKLTMYLDRPEWAHDVIGLGAQEALQVAAGETGRLPLETAGEVRVAVDLLKDDSAVELAVIGVSGEVLRTLAAAASTPVRWMADLGTVEVGARVELRVLRGRAAGGVIRADGGGLRPITAAAIVGSAQFSVTVNYPQGVPNLYYTVTGGPPNTCGELNSYRNGSWIFGANWLCTDASGNATKGPWTWAGTPSDQTDEPAFIRWPNGDTTNNAIHVWDKNCVQAFRTTPSGSPPTSWAGYATDTQWGAGFDFGPTALSVFQNKTTGLYWDPATGGYTASYKTVSTTLSRVNRWRANWTTAFPSAGAHQSGHSYSWTTCATDGGCGYCTVHNFSVP